MAFLPNVPFVEGQPFTPELAYESFQAPYFDDQPEYLGHRQRLLDSELSNTPGQIKSRFTAVEGALQVGVHSGLTLTYKSGAVMLPGGSLYIVSGGLVTAPDNTTSFVFVDELGAVKCEILPPVLTTLMAKVVTVGGQVSLLQDWRAIDIKKVQPRADTIRVFGGTNLTDLVCTPDQVFNDGAYYYRNFTVPSGVSITVSKFARFHCSGKVNIAGTINVTVLSSGASGYGTVVYGYSGTVGGLTGGGAGGGSGSAAAGGNSGASYSYAAQPYGSGGGLGYAALNIGAVTAGMSIGFGAGGSGGGGVIFEAFDAIVITGTILAKGDPANPTTLGEGVANGSISGSGGGSGGLILLSSPVSVTATATATLDVRGGAGATGHNNGDGGSGGGGGQIVLMAPTTNSTGATLLFSGGAKGAAGQLAASFGGGTGGGFGGNGGRQSAGSAGKLIIRNFVPIG